MLSRMSERQQETLTVDETFGRLLAQHRRRAGLTQQQLAELVADHGGSLHQTTIARTERGERQPTLGEFLLFAAALNVPPPLLLLPVGDEDVVAVTPRSHVHPHLAYKWLAGRGPLASSDRKAIGVRQWHEAARPLRLHDHHDELADRVRQAQADARRAALADDAEQTTTRQGYADALAALVDHRRVMRREGIQPPALPDEWRDDAAMLDTDEAEEG